MANSLQRHKVSYLQPVEIPPPTDREILDSHSEQIAILWRSITELTNEIKRLQQPRSELKRLPKSKPQSKVKLIRNSRAPRTPNLSNQLRDARIKRGLSVAELAEQVGVSASSIYFWEADYCRPRERNMSALCKVLKLKATE